MSREQPPTLEDYTTRWAERTGWRFAKRAEGTIVKLSGQPLDERALQALWGMFTRALVISAPNPQLAARTAAAKDLRKRRRRAGIGEATTADVVEPVDTAGSNPAAERHAGSSPAVGMTTPPTPDICAVAP